MSEEKISLEEGAGGSATMKLIKEIFLKSTPSRKIGPVGIEKLDDGAAIDIEGKNLIFTTDSHTIDPLFFPGGNIGKLAVAGTVNDLAVMGGEPLAMSSAFVISEGFPRKKLRKIARSINETAESAGVNISTGDTKVVEKEALDGVIISTSGIGIANQLVTDEGLNPGDKIIVTGNIGEHETAILTTREELKISGNLKSDVAPLWETIEVGLNVGGITAMKDPTRGGLAGALNEIAEKSKVGITLEEEKIPVSTPVKNVGEMLGIGPLHLTNEGKAIIGVKSEKSEPVLEAIKDTEMGTNARIVGTATKEHPQKVVMETEVGGKRLIRTPIGAPTPRIC